MLADLGQQVVAVGPDETFEAAGFSVRTFGGQHALIHPLIPIVANVGYVVEDTVAHPGDSLIVPPVPVQTLLLPVVAPWSKVAEVIDYLVAVRADRAYPIHDAIVGDLYHGLLQMTLVPIARRFGLDYRNWDGPITARTTATCPCYAGIYPEQARTTYELRRRVAVQLVA
jgi:hypothetical protein